MSSPKCLRNFCLTILNMISKHVNFWPSPTLPNCPVLFHPSQVMCKHPAYKRGGHLTEELIMPITFLRGVLLKRNIAQIKGLKKTNQCIPNKYTSTATSFFQLLLLICYFWWDFSRNIAWFSLKIISCYSFRCNLNKDSESYSFGLGKRTQEINSESPACR